MDVVGIHQIFKVAEWSHGEAQGKRDQDNQCKRATISRLGCPCGFWERFGQDSSIQE
jgi:hypothetical protein